MKIELDLQPISTLHLDIIKGDKSAEIAIIVLDKHLGLHECRAVKYAHKQLADKIWFWPNINGHEYDDLEDVTHWAPFPNYEGGK